MEFRELKTFQVVASLMSFNKAADVIHLAQSTISAQIRSLEQSLGKELFYRNGKTIGITPAGVKLLSYVQRLINIEKEIKNEMGNLDNKYGSLTIKTPQSISTYVFPELIRSFNILFPKIGFDIDWCTSYHLLDIINTGTIDLAFLVTDRFEDKQLQIEKIAEIKLVLAAGPGDKLCKRTQVTIHDLEGKTLLFAKSECNYKKIIQQMIIKQDVRPEKIIEINSLEAVKRLVMLKSGVAFMPELVIRNELKMGVIDALNWRGDNLNANLVMIWSKERHISEPLRAFMTVIRKMMKDFTGEERGGRGTRIKA